MNTTTDTNDGLATKQVKKATTQITINVTDVDKVKVNAIKEDINLTDKELVSVLLELYSNTDKSVLTGLIEKVQREKALAKVKARLEKVERERAELQEQLDS